MEGVIGQRLVGMEAAVETGRRSKLAELYSEHAPKAGRLAFLLTGDRDLAEDIAQEAFARIAGRFAHLRDEDAFAGYLRRTVVNLTQKHWRRAARERSYAEREGPIAERQRAWLPDTDTRDALWEALVRLPYRQRVAIALRFYEDLPERDIAAAMRCPTGTVKSLIFRGLRAMRDTIGGDER